MQTDARSARDEQWEAFLQAIDDTLYKALWREAYRIVRSAADADDVLQDALIKGGRSFAQLLDPQRLPAWMFTIVRREAYRLTGRHKARALLCGLQLSMGAVRGPSPDDLVIERDLTEQVKSFIATLDETTQTLLRLRMTTDWPLSRIAERVGLLPETAKSRYYRTRKQIERLIREEGDKHDAG